MAIKNEDFKALVKVFKAAVNEMAEKDTYFERKAVIAEWISLMTSVDHAMGNLIMTESKEERRKMVREFEESLKDFDYLEDV